MTDRKFLLTSILTALLLLNTVLQFCNFRFERVDLPNVTKKLVIDTIKGQLAVDAKTKEVKNLENVLDEISYANQLGRLDAISLLIAGFALILGFGAIAGFMHIKEVSEGIAERETKRWLDSEEGGKAIEKAIEKHSKSRSEADNKKVRGKAKDRGKREATVDEGELVPATKQKD
jgi:hypothetical protein